MRRPLRVAIACLVLLVGIVSPASSAPTTNGGFETGNFTGWTVTNQAGGSGNWFVYSGTVSPLSGFTIAAPPEGTFAAVTDQFGPGSHVLHQDVALAGGTNHALVAFYYYRNRAGAFFTPDTLDFNVFPNQQYVFDILNPASPPNSPPSAALATVARTNPGEPLTLDPVRIFFDMTPFAGQTVRIRFAEVDNQSFFQASTDDVQSLSCTITGSGDIAGTPGDDVICGSNGPDRIAGGGGDDVIFGNGGNDQLAGGPGEDGLFGGDGNDDMAGGADDDQLNGGNDFDRLAGGDGDDRCLVEGGGGLVGGTCESTTNP